MARSLAERAANLSGDDPLILAVLGAVHTFVRNYGTARVLLERAFALDPNCAWAWSRLGWVENYADQPHKGDRKLRARATPQSDRSDEFQQLCWHRLGARNGAGVRQGCGVLPTCAVGRAPNASWIYRNLASTLSGAGRIDEAKQAFAEMMRNYPDLTTSKFKQAMVFSGTTLDRMAENLRKLGLPD